MDVGVNYPWFNYAWDFGEAPPSYPRPNSGPNWVVNIESDLQLFRRLGIRVVRWFIMADGLMYGIEQQAPRLDTDPVRTPQWRFDDPPALSEAFQTHFRMLLERFERMNQIPRRPIRLLPVLIDFRFCLPGVGVPGRQDEIHLQSLPKPEWVKGGRSDIINDPRKRRRFFTRALEPLLRISKDHRNVIYAWEIINEPEWVTNGWHPHGERNLPISDRDMASFLREGIGHIRTAGFKVTVGFNRIDTLRRSGIYADINQFHHYSHPDKPKCLGRFDPQSPSIIGEFATSPNEDTWPELKSVGQRILNRLRYAELMGYPLVLLWSYKQRDGRTSWTSEVEQDIECFTLRRNCPRTIR